MNKLLKIVTEDHDIFSKHYENKLALKKLCPESLRKLQVSLTRKIAFGRKHNVGVERTQETTGLYGTAEAQSNLGTFHF